MTKHLYKLTFILALGASLAWGQRAAQNPPQTTATPNVQAQNPPPDQSAIPTNQQNPSTAPLSQAQGSPTAAGQSANQPMQQSPQPAPDQAKSAQASKLPQSDATSGGDLKGTIQLALQREPNLKDSSISVSQNGGGIELSGTATNRKQKKMAEHIAKANADGRPVMNHIKVTGAPYHSKQN